MNRPIKALALVLVAAALAAVPAAAQGYGPHRHGPGHGRGRADLLAHMTEELGLTGDQQLQVKAVLSKYMHGTLGDTMHAMREAHGALGQAVHNPEATDQEVQDAAAAVSTIEAQAAVERHHMALEISSVLTPDQRAKLAQMKQRRFDRQEGPPSPSDGDF